MQDCLDLGRVDQPSISILGSIIICQRSRLNNEVKESGRVRWGDFEAGKMEIYYVR